MVPEPITDTTLCCDSTLRHHNYSSTQSTYAHQNPTGMLILHQWHTSMTCLPSWYSNPGEFRLNIPTRTWVSVEAKSKTWGMLTDDKICLSSAINMNNLMSVVNDLLPRLRSVTHFRTSRIMRLQICLLWGPNIVVIAQLQDASILPLQKIEG